jgi:hypothetical protein
MFFYIAKIISIGPMRKSDSIKSESNSTRSLEPPIVFSRMVEPKKG